MEELILLGKRILPGENKQIDLDLAKLHTRTTLNVPIIVSRSKEPGPTLLLMGGIHGNEMNGVEIVRRIIRQGLNKPKAGTVIAVPVFNIFGFLNLSRQFPDGRDLNRVFPGSPNGSLASQFAHVLTTGIAPLIDYAIDFHTGGADRFNAPQMRCVIKEERTFELAKAFGAPFLLNSPRIPKSVRDTLTKMGKTVLLYEAGKTNSFDEIVIEYGVEGAMNVMRYLGMKEPSFKPTPKSIIVSKSKWIRAAQSGMFRVLVENGAWVKKKTVLGIISDPYGEMERKVTAPSDCYILCVNTTPIINKGDALFHISTEVL